MVVPFGGARRRVSRDRARLAAAAARGGGVQRQENQPRASNFLLAGTGNALQRELDLVEPGSLQPGDRWRDRRYRLAGADSLRPAEPIQRGLSTSFWKICRGGC